jgi:hypothetical protein
LHFFSLGIASVLDESVAKGEFLREKFLWSKTVFLNQSRKETHHLGGDGAGAASRSGSGSGSGSVSGSKLMFNIGGLSKMSQNVSVSCFPMNFYNN